MAKPTDLNTVMSLSSALPASVPLSSEPISPIIRDGDNAPLLSGLLISSLSVRQARTNQDRSLNDLDQQVRPLAHLVDRPLPY